MVFSPEAMRQHVAAINLVDNPLQVRHSGRMRKSFKVADECWIRLYGAEGTHRGIIAAIIIDDSVTQPFYVIRLDNYTWPHYEVRDAVLMGSSASDHVPTMDKAFQPGWKSPGVQ